MCNFCKHRSFRALSTRLWNALPHYVTLIAFILLNSSLRLIYLDCIMFYVNVFYIILKHFVILLL